MLVTESGRFHQNRRICLSISDYHPESWNPVWPVRSIIIGLISFFVTEEHTVGSYETPFDQRKKIAMASCDKVAAHPMFQKCLGEWKGNIGMIKNFEKENNVPIKISESPKLK